LGVSLFALGHAGLTVENDAAASWHSKRGGIGLGGANARRSNTAAGGCCQGASSTEPRNISESVISRSARRCACGSTLDDQRTSRSGETCGSGALGWSGARIWMAISWCVRECTSVARHCQRSICLCVTRRTSRCACLCVGGIGGTRRVIRGIR